MNTHPTDETIGDLKQLLWHVADHGGGEMYDGDEECPDMQDYGACISCTARSLIVELELM